MRFPQRRHLTFWRRPVLTQVLLRSFGPIFLTYPEVLTITPGPVLTSRSRNTAPALSGELQCSTKITLPPKLPFIAELTLSHLKVELRS